MKRGVDSEVRARINESFDLSLFIEGEVLLEQGEVKLYKKVDLDNETRIASAVISAEETLMFEPGSYKIKFRFRVKDMSRKETLEDGTRQWMTKTISSRTMFKNCGEGFDEVMQ